MEWTAAGDTLFVGHFVSVTQEGLFFARGLFLGLLKYPQDYFFVVIGTHLSASLWPKAAEMWVFRVLVVKESTPDRTRTCDPGIRNPMLYPTELRARYSLFLPQPCHGGSRRCRKRVKEPPGSGVGMVSDAPWWRAVFQRRGSLQPGCRSQAGRGWWVLGRRRTLTCRHRCGVPS